MPQRLVKFLDYENHSLFDFVTKFNKDGGPVAYPLENLTKTRFDLNETDITVSSIEDEIQDQLVKVFEELASIPVGGEITHPAVVAINQSWCQYIAKSWKTWHNHFSSAVVLHFYRRITTPEYQTPGHMRLVYAVCTALEWVTTTTIVRDDMFDHSSNRGESRAWHLDHSTSTPNDILVATDMAKLVLKHIVPKDHPCHGALGEQLDDYARRCNYYFTYHSWLAEANARGTGSKTNVPIDGATMDTLRSFNWFRSEQYMLALFEFARLCACYQSVPLNSCRYYFFQISAILCVADDLRDMTPEGACDDILSGEIHNIFLPLALQLRDGLPEDEATDFTNTMNTCYGTYSRDDAMVVKKMYWKHRVPERVLDHLNGMLDDLEKVVKREAVTQCNVPPDVMDFALAYMLCNEPGINLRHDILALHHQDGDRNLSAMISTLLQHDVIKSRKRSNL
ncbi:hypothetical protein HDE_09502 [Halotydeus destructor]|nr:hypothetical protein HDE_09502 [Halotydeus destructor]